MNLTLLSLNIKVFEFESLNLLLSPSVAVKPPPLCSTGNIGFYMTDCERWTLHKECLPISLFRSIRHLLSVDSAKTLVSAFVLSMLGCSNSLLFYTVLSTMKNNKRFKTRLQKSCSKLVKKIKHIKYSKERLFIRTQTRNLQIFVVCQATKRQS